MWVPWPIAVFRQQRVEVAFVRGSSLPSGAKCDIILTKHNFEILVLIASYQFVANKCSIFQAFKSYISSRLYRNGREDRGEINTSTSF